MHRFRNLVLLLGLIGATASPVVAAEMVSIKQEATTAHYRLELQIGATEKMFTAAEVAAKHLTAGEVMVGGGMSMGMSMDMGDTRHLEVHVYALDTGKVVTNAQVAITVTDTGSKKVQKISVAKMYGIKEGAADTHYGNNVSLPSESYRIAVTVNDETAEFSLAIPSP